MDFQQELEALYQKAMDLKTRGLFKEAEALEGQAAKLLQKLRTHAEEHREDPATAPILLYLAEKEWPLYGDDEQILSKLTQALALREKHGGREHPLTAEVLAKLAEFHYLAGRFGEAQGFFERAISLLEKHGEAHRSVYARALEGLAQMLAVMGRPEDADPYFVRAIEWTASDEQGQRSLYFLLIYRADGLEKLGRGAEARPLRARAAALLPKNNPGELGFHV